MLFSTVTVSIYISTNDVEGSLLSMSSSTLVTLVFLMTPIGQVCGGVSVWL